MTPPPAAAPLGERAQPTEGPLLAALHALFDETATPALAGLADAHAPLMALRRTVLEPAAEFLGRPGKRFRGRLVELTWELAGAPGAAPPALAQVVELIHAGSMIVDDIEDGSTHRRNAPALHRLYGMPMALNTGNLLYFLPLALLRGWQLPPPLELALHRRIARTMLRAHYGQALDLGTRAADLDAAQLPALVRAITALKTGELMALAATIGPIAADCAPARVETFAAFGTALGTALQMLDDLGNLRGGRDPHKRHEDLRLGRATWVWAWAAETLRPQELARLQRQARAVDAGRAPAEPLAARLRAAVGASGRARAHAELGRALDEFAAALGSAPALPALRAACARIEASYG